MKYILLYEDGTIRLSDTEPTDSNLHGWMSLEKTIDGESVAALIEAANIIIRKRK